MLGTVEEFATKRLVEREAASFLARVNRLDYRPVSGKSERFFPVLQVSDSALIKH